jgi:AmiR/NasT family two-component response regulator
MISGDSTAHNVIHAKVKGHCAAFLVKPIDKERLIEALVEAKSIEPGGTPDATA